MISCRQISRAVPTTAAYIAYLLSRMPAFFITAKIWFAGRRKHLRIWSAKPRNGRMPIVWDFCGRAKNTKDWAQIISRDCGGSGGAGSILFIVLFLGEQERWVG